MPSQESTDLFIAVGAVAKRLKSRQVAAQETLQGIPFAPRHVATLLQIGHDEPVGMSELAERMNVSLATASQVVTDLEEWGLVERVTDPSDRRRTSVRIAAAHRPAISAIFEQRLRPLGRTLRRLEPEERSALIRGLRVLAEELDRAAGDAPTKTTRKETAR
jgi:DNA-binding MarR family transcriptional regulator